MKLLHRMGTGDTLICERFQWHPLGAVGGAASPTEHACSSLLFRKRGELDPPKPTTPLDGAG